MCIVYITIGTLTEIKEHLEKHNVTGFNSVAELVEFQNNFETKISQVKLKYRKQIENEKIELERQTQDLNNSVDSIWQELENTKYLELAPLHDKLEKRLSDNASLFKVVITFISKMYYRNLLRRREKKFDRNINKILIAKADENALKNNRLQSILNDFDRQIDNAATFEVTRLYETKRIIDEINTTIYGAFGEHKVAKELEKLSDDYILINNFQCTFDPPIYYKQENHHIISIQADHVLIGPSGVFIIETKNWSKDSIESADLRSPITQIKRTNYALYMLLSGHISEYKRALRQHHWGVRTIPVRNIVALTNYKFYEDFQFVKVLLVSELCGYISYFQPLFSTHEVHNIADYLLSINQSQGQY